MREVSVIVPNYNGEQFLPICLNSLRKQTLKNIEIIVVDNGSTDDSLKILSENFTDVILVSLGENKGISHALNVGIRRAEAPYVILLSADTEVKDNFAEELLKAIKRNKKAFSCGAKMCSFFNRDLIDNAGYYYNAMGQNFPRGKGKPEEHFSKNKDMFAVSGEAAIYRKDIFERIGYFDEAHFSYIEDIDICYRARIFGYKNRFIPSAVAYHVGNGAGTEIDNHSKIRLLSRNGIYIIYKNMPLFQILLNLPFLVIGFISKLIHYSRRRLGLDYLKGVKDGILSARRNCVKIRYTGFGKRCYLRIQLELWINMFKKITG